MEEVNLKWIVDEHGESYICAQRDTGITRIVNIKKRQLSVEDEEDPWDEIIDEKELDKVQDDFLEESL